MKPSRHNKRGAFSLVEVMVAILVLGIALVGLTQGITTALGCGKESELQTIAAQLAAGKVEELRADEIYTDEDTDGDFGESFSRYRWKESVTATKISGLHDVVVTIEDAKSSKTIYELRTQLFELPTDDSPSTDTSGNKRKTSQKNGGRQR